MYIQFKSETSGYACVSSYFEKQDSFLKSLALGQEFKIYEKEDPNKIHKVIKKIIIKTVKPLNEGKSLYLTFTAMDFDNKNILYEGMICFE
jgi:hypothetical protein